MPPHSVSAQSTDAVRSATQIPLSVPATVVVPTFNEGGNVRELVRQLSAAMPTCEVLFVDDSTDDTPRVIQDVAATSEVTVRLIARGQEGLGGLAGAVAISDVRIGACADQHPDDLLIDSAAVAKDHRFQ